MAESGMAVKSFYHIPEIHPPAGFPVIVFSLQLGNVQSLANQVVVL